MKFLISLLVFIFLWLPVALLGIVIVPIMLWRGWQGYTTIWGNWIYGREGNAHVQHPATFLASWNFLSLRNPCSNWGKHYLGVPYTQKWAWHEFKWIFEYGWQMSPPDPRETKGKFLFGINRDAL